MREYAGGRPSQSSAARRPSPCTPTLLGTEEVLRYCVRCVIDFCLYAAVLRMERCVELVPVFFDIYSGTLCRSDSRILQCLSWYAGPIWFLDSSVLIVVRWADLGLGFFSTYTATLRQFSFWTLRYLYCYSVPI